MNKRKNLQRPDHDLEAEALAALEEARAMPHGPERALAMKKAGSLRTAAGYRVCEARKAHEDVKRVPKSCFRQLRSITDSVRMAEDLI
jgi:hypothetical protein